MKKTILYRLFGLGAIPGKLRPILELESIVVLDEGIGGWFLTKNVRGPGKRFLRRSEGFSGCLAVTEKRVVCFTNWKRQINISVEDPKIAHLYVGVPAEDILSISFESSVFREGWEGVIEFRFKTEKAMQFSDVLRSVGAQQGAAPGSNSAMLV